MSPASRCSQSVLPSGDFDLAHFSWGREPETSNSTILRCGGSQNWTGYCQRLVTRDIDEAGRVLDAEQHMRVLNRLDARVALDVPLIPLYHRPFIGAARSTVRGFVLRATVDPFLGAENWWLARALTAALAAALLVAVPGAAGAPGAETPRRGGTLVLDRRSPGVGVPERLLRALRRGRIPFPFMVMGMVLPGAYRLGPDLTLRPHLVSRVDVTKTPPFTLTYHIRPEARWSDGTPVSARDFVFTHQTSYSAGSSYTRYTRRRSPRSTAFAALDARTVRVVLRSRFGGWRRLFPYVLPAHALAGADFATVWNDGIDDPRTGRPIGSGPFLVRRWDRGREITFERNPRYWRGRLGVSRPARVPFLGRTIAGDRGAAAGRARPRPRPPVFGRRGPGGSAAGSGGPRASSVPGAPGSTSRSVSRLLVIRLCADKLVRRAIAHAIDKPALARAVLGEAEGRNAMSESAVFATTNRYYRPNWSGLRYDPAESARLLRQAGCRLGTDGIYVCAGEPLRLRAFTIGGERVPRGRLADLSEQLRRRGIELVPTYVRRRPAVQSVLAKR